MGFSRQEYWSGLPCPPPENLPDPGIELVSPAPAALAGGFFIIEPPRKPLIMYYRELENKTTLFITEPWAGHTYPVISFINEIKLIRLLIVLKNIDALKQNKTKQNKTIHKSNCKSTLGMCLIYQKYSESILVFIRSICCCPAKMIWRYRGNDQCPGQVPLPAIALCPRSHESQLVPSPENALSYIGATSQGGHMTPGCSNCDPRKREHTSNLKRPPVSSLWGLGVLHSAPSGVMGELYGSAKHIALLSI